MEALWIWIRVAMFFFLENHQRTKSDKNRQRELHLMIYKSQISSFSVGVWKIDISDRITSLFQLETLVSNEDEIGTRDQNAPAARLFAAADQLKRQTKHRRYYESTGYFDAWLKEVILFWRPRVLLETDGLGSSMECKTTSKCLKSSFIFNKKSNAALNKVLLIIDFVTT